LKKLSGATSRCLSRIAIRLRRKIRLVERMGSRMVELDIAACRIERDIAADWVRHRNKINEELDRLGVTEAEWCRRELGCSIQTMRRRVQLLKGWSQYLKRRREVGDNGQFGLLYAAFLAAPALRTTFARTLGLRASVPIPDCRICPAASSSLAMHEPSFSKCRRIP
jgi:hypothetical protein